MAMVRFDVFRYDSHFVHVMISLHTLLPIVKTERKGVFHATKILFKERYGEVSNESAVSFMSNAGERVTISEVFIPGFQAALAGSRCRACKCKSHFANLKPILLPDILRQGLKLPVLTPQPRQGLVQA
jgi:hypothetical protein